MRLTLRVLLSLSFAIPVWAESRRDVMDLCLQGRFDAVDRVFRATPKVPGFGCPLVWLSECDIERGRCASAAALLRQAKAVDKDAYVMEWRRRARLLCATGQFSEATKIALNGQKWGGASIAKLKLDWAMPLNTIAKHYLVMGRYAEAAVIFEKAALRAKKTPDIDLDEWIGAVNGLARCSLAAGSSADARAFRERALELADRRWGRGSIPAWTRSTPSVWWISRGPNSTTPTGCSARF